MSYSYFPKIDVEYSGPMKWTIEVDGKKMILISSSTISRSKTIVKRSFVFDEIDVCEHCGTILDKPKFDTSNRLYVSVTSKSN